MAGVRRLRSGTVQVWYRDWQGRRCYLTVGAEASESKTLKKASKLELEHKEIREGLRPAPAPSAKHARRPIAEVMQEYLDWGKAQGGRGGRPWARQHAYMLGRRLTWWRDELGLEALGDMAGILPHVEKRLRQALANGKAGKTCSNLAEALRGFANWCVKRNYLPANPIAGLAPFDCTPTKIRRAMTPDEFRRLLEVAPPHRKLLYQVATLTGLRRQELRSLVVSDLDAERCGIHVRAEISKDRKYHWQPIPRTLLGELQASIDSGAAKRLYGRHYVRRDSTARDIPDEPLLFVASQPAREMADDLAQAGIPKTNLRGELVLHSCRVTYINWLLEQGANAKEAMVLARHAGLDMTLGVYGRTREERLSELVEKLGERTVAPQKCAHSVRRLAAGAEGLDPSYLHVKDLQHINSGGGEGARTLDL